MGDTIHEAVDVTAQRIDEVNAVLDVVQDELEDAAITAITAVRGVRLGARELLSHLPRRRRKKRRRGEGRPRDDDRPEIDQPENDQDS
jgi:hypothetical protein